MQVPVTCLVVHSSPYMPLNIINVLLFFTGLIEQVTTLGSDTGTLHTAEHWKYLQGESISYLE